ncbi:hypothetical protein HDR61_05500 [bacterium]|nr:hypothetical protein [bacterium]MBD5401163.1 hypothetical protein [bacterium]
MKPIRLNSTSTPSVAKKRANKYGNHPTGGHSSRKEHRRAITLRILQRAGRITNLREQVPFDLIPAQCEWCGEKSDELIYTEDRQKVCIDCIEEMKFYEGTMKGI